jgi:hypothetical protein
MSAKYNKTKGAPAQSVQYRLEKKRTITKSGCWEFTGCRNKDGYGMIGIFNEVKSTHRVSYEIYIGPIPDGLCVCHTCDNPPCFNPQHLFIGTHKDNMIDMQSKGRTGIKYAEDNPQSKLTKEQVDEIRRLHIPTYRGGRGSNTLSLAKQYGVSRSHINRIINKRWRVNG